MPIFSCECCLCGRGTPFLDILLTHVSPTLSAASALAANTILRSTAGAVFPLFATYMVCEFLRSNFDNYD